MGGERGKGVAAYAPTGSIAPDTSAEPAAVLAAIADCGRNYDGHLAGLVGQVASNDPRAAATVAALRTLNAQMLELVVRLSERGRTESTASATLRGDEPLQLSEQSLLADADPDEALR
jgi:hypothetical protein